MNADNLNSMIMALQPTPLTPSNYLFPQCNLKKNELKKMSTHVREDKKKNIQN